MPRFRVVFTSTGRGSYTFEADDEDDAKSKLWAGAATIDGDHEWEIASVEDVVPVGEEEEE